MAETTAGGTRIVKRAGAPAPIPEGTIPELFFDAVARYDKADAWRVRRPGGWESLSHRWIAEEVRRCALGLRALGLAPGDRAAILSENRPEWHLADFACATSGVVSVPLYATLPAAQIEFMLRDSGARLVFVSTAEQLEKVQTLRRACADLAHVVAFEPELGGRDVLTLDDLRDRGDAALAGAGADRHRALAGSVRPHDLLTILYTSGTTGRPKGVMLTHNNLVSNVRASLEILPVGPTDVALSFLPLSHILERMVDYAFFSAGVTIAYCESFQRVGDYLAEVRPTVAAAVPRVYEKVYAAVHERAAAAGAARRRLFAWAVRVARAWAEARLAGRRANPALALQHALADRLVYAKVRARMGGRVRYFLSGGAPLDPALGIFFFGLGVRILEGYGLTETSPVIAVNRPDRIRFGTVGPPIPGVEVAIAEDGEILTRGPHVMKGYYGLPEETAAVLEPDGWFHTGDVGDLDEDGYLRVTDRKKDLLKTAGGKYVAPQPIENRVKRNPFVAQAVVLGDRRPYPILLVVPNFGRLEVWARERGIEVGDRAQLVEHPAVREWYETTVLGSLDDLASFERPKKIVLLPEEFTLDRGEMTPTDKVRRRVVEERYAAFIERAYASGSAPAIPEA